MAELSPAALSVMVAATSGNTNVVNDPVYKQCIAAALRAVADQPYEVPPHVQGEAYWPFRNGVDAERSRLLAIAAELEGATPGSSTHLEIGDE